MAFKSAQKTRVLLGDFSLSPKLTKISLPLSVDMHDTTTFADDARRFIPGQDTSTASLSGFLDVETAADSAAWTTQQPLTYGPHGIALGDSVQMVDTLRSSFEVGSQVAGVVSFDIGAQTDGFTNFGVSLKDLAAVTANGNGTAVDGAAATTAGGVAHLHVTAFSGFTNIVVVIADSADNSSFATIGTFATATGVTGERLAIAGTVRRYVRYTVTVTGTGSATFAVAFARL